MDSGTSLGFRGQLAVKAVSTACKVQSRSSAFRALLKASQRGPCRAHNRSAASECTVQSWRNTNMQQPQYSEPGLPNTGQHVTESVLYWRHRIPAMATQSI